MLKVACAIPREFLRVALATDMATLLDCVPLHPTQPKLRASHFNLDLNLWQGHLSVVLNPNSAARPLK